MQAFAGNPGAGATSRPAFRLFQMNVLLLSHTITLSASGDGAERRPSRLTERKFGVNLHGWSSGSMSRHCSRMWSAG